MKTADSNEQSQLLIELMQKIKKLEGNVDDNRKMQFQLEMLEGKTRKLCQRIDIIEQVRTEMIPDKENEKSGTNLLQK